MQMKKKMAQKKFVTLSQREVRDGIAYGMMDLRMG